jgi:hypothetical protein
VPDATPTTNGDVALEDDDELLEAGAPDDDATPDLDDMPELDEPEPLPDDAAIDELADDFGPDEVGEEALDFEPNLAALEVEPAQPAARGDDVSDRLQRLEQAAQALVAAQVDRDGRRVRRKVSAATLGAFVTALIPMLLDVVGALNLDPELTSTITAGAALVGAFAAGWATPEREPSLPTEVLRP